MACARGFLLWLFRGKDEADEVVWGLVVLMLVLYATEMMLGIVAFCKAVLSRFDCCLN